ncbi:MAG: phosphopyruvate hydratase [bacterium]|nr:phosphopyruvate hydratase [bacterium]
MRIKKIKAREILSSGATPSLEVKVTLNDGSVGVASVPFGVSAGTHEAFVLLDGDKKRYGGKGMLKAVANVNKKIAPKLIDKNPLAQKKIDQTMIDLDGTANKSKLGGNAILGVSLAVARAAARAKQTPLYDYIREAFQLPYKNYQLPKPMMVLIEGGKHAANSTDLQEYLIAVTRGKNIKELVRRGAEIYLALKQVLKEKNLNANVGNEGAFAPEGLKNNEAPWQLILQAIKKAGYGAGKDVMLAADPAVSEIFAQGKYRLTKEKKSLSSRQMINYFKKWVAKYPFLTLEDPLSEDDWQWWPVITRELGKKIRIIGDDLTVTNPARLAKAIKLKAINAILIKLNQIGTLSETIKTIEMAHQAGMWSIVSHRGGGETNDTFMIDLAVATNSEFVKVGVSRGERVEKYNRLMEIEDELKSS